MTTLTGPAMHGESSTGIHPGLGNTIRGSWAWSQEAELQTARIKSCMLFWGHRTVSMFELWQMQPLSLGTSKLQHSQNQQLRSALLFCMHADTIWLLNFGILPVFLNCYLKVLVGIMDSSLSDVWSNIMYILCPIHKFYINVHNVHYRNIRFLIYVYVCIQFMTSTPTFLLPPNFDADWAKLPQLASASNWSPKGCRLPVLAHLVWEGAFPASSLPFLPPEISIAVDSGSGQRIHEQSWSWHDALLEKIMLNDPGNFSRKADTMI